MYYGRKWSGITPEKYMQHVDAYIRWNTSSVQNYRWVQSAPKCTANHVGKYNKAVTEIVRIPNGANNPGVDIVLSATSECISLSLF